MILVSNKGSIQIVDMLLGSLTEQYEQETNTDQPKKPQGVSAIYTEVLNEFGYSNLFNPIEDVEQREVLISLFGDCYWLARL